MIAAVDLGTSSVKVMLASETGCQEKIRESYQAEGVEGFKVAAAGALRKIKGKISAVCLTSQTGTYSVDGKHIISWQSRAGEEEIRDIKKIFSQEEFIREIGMAHPDIVSYPMPRIMYIKKQFPDAKRICQIKDEIVNFLTGEYVTDVYTWRGLANSETGRYSKKMLRFLNIDERMLPRLETPFAKAGYITKEAEKLTGIEAGTPVFTGCNDYYAGLLGMGITKSGAIFDITGTSEHIGVTLDEFVTDNKAVYSPYFGTNVLYGVTGSSGSAMSFGIKNFPFDRINIEKSLEKNAPIFLPYLAGARAPIYDSKARGVFFGISRDTEAYDMAYSVLEGAAFSAYAIYETIKDKVNASFVLTAGGAAADLRYNLLKASLFGKEFLTLEETDTSALGACMIGLTALGKYKNIDEAARVMCKIKSQTMPREIPVLKERFRLYKKIYESNKNNFTEFGRIKK